MPVRQTVAKELCALLGVLSHPARLQIVEELSADERDVATLAATLGIAHSGVSQHLSIMRAHRIVVERRDGRRVLYRLRRPELAQWLTGGLTFLNESASESDALREAVQTVRELWSGAETQS